MKLNSISMRINLTRCVLANINCVKCDSKHYLSFAVNKIGVRKFYDNAVEQKYISFTNETVFEVKFFEKCDLRYNIQTCLV
jgi:hypothetical protein